MTGVFLGFLAGAAVGIPIALALSWFVDRIRPYRHPPYHGPLPPIHPNCRCHPLEEL